MSKRANGSLLSLGLSLSRLLFDTPLPPASLLSPLSLSDRTPARSATEKSTRTSGWHKKIPRLACTASFMFFVLLSPLEKTRRAPTPNYWDASIVLDIIEVAGLHWVATQRLFSVAQPTELSAADRPSDHRGAAPRADG